MAECIYSNNINKSILTSGFTIPVDKWDTFAKCLGTNLQKGERKEIVVWLGQLKCSATYTNVNLTGENAGRTVFRFITPVVETALSSFIVFTVTTGKHLNISSPTFPEYTSSFPPTAS